VIISHQHRFIFIKNLKTAGTSIEIGLSRFCGPRDVITATSSADERIRRHLGYPGPRNYRKPITAYTRRNWRRLLRRRRWSYYYLEHMSARAVRKRVGRRVWRSYFKFCFERNPWDKVVSRYYWAVHRPTRYGRTSRDRNMTLSEFVHSGKIGRFSDLSRYTIKGRIAVDFVGRYESLEDDLAYVADRLGLPARIELPHAKGDIRPRVQGHRELFGERERELIAQGFAREIELFDYTC